MVQAALAAAPRPSRAEVEAALDRFEDLAVAYGDNPRMAGTRALFAAKAALLTLIAGPGAGA